MSPEEVVGRLRRPGGFLSEKVREATRRIVADVRERGNEALLEYTERFDGVRPELRVPEEEIERAGAELEEGTAESLRVAIANVQKFHEWELESSWQVEEGGAVLGQRVSPLGRAGLYVPGGHAAYPSTLVMSAVPAQAAGVREIAICSPPGPDGRVNPLVLATASLLGLNEVYAVGGAQAVAAMASGTESVRAVNKVCGPGNDYVTAAKLEVFGAVGIDAPQGPSEIAVIADDSADPRYVASDLMAQAEHLAEASAILLTPDEGLIDEVEPLLSGTPAEHVTLVRVEDLEQAVEVSNSYAPEHAHVVTEEAEQVASRLVNAGLVAVGESSPVAASDYAAGPSHALPTGGAAAWASALSTRDFVRRTSYVRLEQEGLKELAPHVARLARLEGLDHHAKSVRVRLDGDG
jgi:histidinol dehydrogenase